MPSRSRASEGQRLTSVDKVNVLHTSRLWRDVVTELGATEYADVPLDHALVDSFAMTIVTAPETIDVVLTENTFGDILSDVAAAVTGGLGLAASASLGDNGPGIFEPVHGSAPQIAGRGIANPAAMLRSTALLLRHGLGQGQEADALERAIDAALGEVQTHDLGAPPRRATWARPFSATWPPEMATLAIVGAGFCGTMVATHVLRLSPGRSTASSSSSEPGRRSVASPTGRRPRAIR